eukprot:6213078-Pleurochrysis_carterae.AAC.2
MQSASSPMRDMNAAMPSVRDIGPEKRRSARGVADGGCDGGVGTACGRPAGCSASPPVGCASVGAGVGIVPRQGKLVHAHPGARVEACFGESVAGFDGERSTAER